ncbi:MAG: sulfite exporter TauE/SafE family protein [Phreatobacter sp.]
MIDFSAAHLATITLTFFLAGIVKGVTGMGLPTVAMGLLATVMPPVGAASLLIVPSFVTNVWQLLAGPSFKALAARLWLMMIGIMAGTIAGSWLITNDSSGWTTMALGVALIVYAATSLMAWQLAIPARLEPRLSPLIGLATGAITGGTGVFVIPAVPYLQALGLNKEDLIQALGLSFTVSTMALAIGLAGGGAFQFASIGVSVLAVAPALAGMALGQTIRRRVSPATFRRWFLICLLLLGLQLLLRPFL